MLKGLNAIFNDVLFLIAQKVLHCMNDAIILLKMGTRNGIFQLWE